MQENRGYYGFIYGGGLKSDGISVSCTSAVLRKGVKILIAVVIGALLLSGLYTLFNTTIMPTVTSKVAGLFNYTP